MDNRKQYLIFGEYLLNRFLSFGLQGKYAHAVMVQEDGTEI